MYTLKLYYPDHTWKSPRTEEIRGDYIPPVGMTLYTDRGAYVVAQLGAGAMGGELSREVAVTLAAEED